MSAPSTAGATAKGDRLAVLLEGIDPSAEAAPNAVLQRGGWIKSAAGSHEVRGKTLGIVGRNTSARTTRSAGS